MLLCILIGLFYIVLRHRGDAYADFCEKGKLERKEDQRISNSLYSNILWKNIFRIWKLAVLCPEIIDFPMVEMSKC